MNVKNSPIAIIGAGPAGSCLAYSLASAGLKVILFTGQKNLEKHCGGGVPARAFDEFPWLREVPAPFRDIGRITVVSPRGNRCDLELSRPLRIFDRSSLDQGFRDRASSAGAHIIPEKVLFVRRVGIAWRIGTENYEHRVSFLIGADGATSLVRRTLSMPICPSSLSLSAGYYLSPPDKDRIFIGFPTIRSTYCWLFPRPGLASVGIVSPLKGTDKKTLLGELQNWLKTIFPGDTLDYSKDYSALIPTFTSRTGTVSGNRWALVGDAAAVADPVTREGIYFSIKSAELLAKAILDNRIESYGKQLRVASKKEHRSARLARRLFFRPFLIERFIRMAAKRGAAHRSLERFFSGSLNYKRLLLQILSKHGGKE